MDGSETAGWVSPLDRDHPLVGRIWDVAAARFVEASTVSDRVQRARFVALGEQHDNADHHRLEAFLLAAASTGRRPAVVFEMIDVDEQTTVDRAAAAHPGDPDAIGAAVDWAHSGWPSWAIYRPVFAVAVGRGLPMKGGGLDRALAHRVAHEGTAALAPDLVRRFALDTPLDPPVRAALRDEMRDAHCGMLPDSMLDAMALIQRARDAELAEKLAEAGADGAVLVAGNGHVRADRGVPRAFSRAVAEPLLTVALLEVRREWRQPAEYAAAFSASALPFDYVWFTPRASDVDHCAELREKRK
ncbi:MAG TPA: ChaN family lipoprotein [Polyangiaceae bacterium]|nr:ChaN family lipoprotein [Polyangiaceae bacterium]